MPFAVLSDIHGNFEAFRAVLADIDRLGIQRMYCLGDTVGYGPDPEECVELLRGRGIASVMGNHEQGVASGAALRWFNPTAREALRKTRAMLSAETLDYLATLPASMVVENCLFVHGCPPDSVRTYLFALDDAALAKRFAAMGDIRLAFVGHTHDLELIDETGGAVTRRPFGQGRHVLDAGARRMVNCGSVGQPRDGDNRAKYVIFDAVEDFLEVRFVPYDFEATAKKIIALGLPEQYARRLY